MTTRGAIGTPGFKSSLVDEVALTGGRAFTGPQELGLTAQRAAKESALAQSLKPTAFTKADSLREAARAITPRAKDPSLFSSLGDSLKNIGGKAKDLLIMNKDGTGVSPLKLAGLAGLAGLATAKGVGEEELEEQDRGPGIDIAAIRRRPFDFMAPRFAGSEFDFYAR